MHLIGKSTNLDSHVSIVNYCDCVCVVYSLLDVIIIISWTIVTMTHTALSFVFAHTGQVLSGDSLFRYPPGQTAADFSYPNHMPDFLQDVVDSASPQLVAACSSDPRCIYDTVQTGDQNIGLATMDTNQDNTMAYQEACE